LLTLAFEAISTFIIIKSQKKQYKIEKIFLALFIPMGILYMIAIPIGRVPDEPAHLARAYGITSGHFITEANEDGLYGEYLPSDLAKLTKNNTTYKNTIEIMTDETGDDEFVFVNDSTIAIYNFVNFIPQSTGIGIGRILHLPPVLTAYLGRLFNLLAFALLFYFAIKLIPFGKNFLFFIAFLPIVLQEAASLSADCMAIALSAALISFCLYLAYDKSSKLTKKNYIILIILILLESLCKIVYLPLCFLIFLIPTKQFKNKKDRIIRTVIPIIAIVIINLIWLKIASRYLLEYNPGVNSGMQTSLVLGNPIKYLQVIFNTCLSSMYQFAYGMFGGWLEWLDVEVGHIYLIASIVIATILTFKISENKLQIPISNRILIICISLSIIGLIFTSLYIQWNPVGNTFVGGLQGRYFIPVFLLVPAIACGLRKNRPTEKNKNTNPSPFYLYAIFQSIAAVTIIICSHMVG
jgi:uncharacterized membrane protein